MAHVQLTLDEYEALRSMAMVPVIAEIVPPPKKKRKKVSKYGKEFGRQFTSLIEKHPRTKPKDLMSKAHAQTRKALGMPRKKK